MIKNKLINIFYILFIFLFGLTVFNTLFNNFYFDYKWFVSIPLAIVWLILIYFAFKFISKKEEWLNKNTVKALGVFFLILTLTQIVVYYFTAGYPSHDLERVFTGAYNYTITGEIQDPYLDYFYKYPNNMPLTIILQFIFRVFYKFGFTNFFVIAAVFNGMTIQIAYLFLFLVVREISNIKFAFFSLAVLFLCLPLQTYISFFYTDTTTMLFPLAIIYFATKIFKNEEKKSLIFNIIMLGIFAGIGMKIKYSVIIAFIAVVIVFLLDKKLAKTILMSISIFLSYMLVSFVIDGFMYENILDKDIAKDMKTPFIAWIAMGMEGEGVHNSNDNHFIWEQETAQDKVDGALLLIELRLEDKGFFGYMSFLNKKMVRGFGSGNLDYIHTVADSPMKQNFAIEILNENGLYNDIYDNIIQGYHILVMLGMILGVIISMITSDRRFLIFQISSLGLFLFLLVWETGTRYLLNYYPIFIVSGIIAVFYFCFENNRNDEYKIYRRR